MSIQPASVSRIRSGDIFIYAIKTYQTSVRLLPTTLFEQSIDPIRKMLINTGIKSDSIYLLESPQDFDSEKFQNASAFIIPGAASTSQLNSALKPVIMKIQEAVFKGMGFLGICAGAIVSSQDYFYLRHSKGGPPLSHSFCDHFADCLPSVKGLDLLKVGAIAPYFEPLPSSKAVRVEDITREVQILAAGKIINVSLIEGPVFLEDENTEKITPIACYITDKSSKHLAIVGGEYGSGSVVFSAVHLELPIEGCQDETLNLFKRIVQILIEPRTQISSNLLQKDLRENKCNASKISQKTPSSSNPKSLNIEKTAGKQPSSRFVKKQPSGRYDGVLPN